MWEDWAVLEKTGPFYPAVSLGGTERLQKMYPHFILVISISFAVFKQWQEMAPFWRSRGGYQIDRQAPVLLIKVNIMLTTKLPVPGLQSSPVCLWIQPSDCERKQCSLEKSYVRRADNTQNTFTLLNVETLSHSTEFRQWPKKSRQEE